MSKNFLQKVIVTLVTVALLCTALALTTFAGKIGDLTIDDAKTYEYAAVTVTKASNSADAVVTVAETYTAYEAGATLDAGLYAVRETGSTDRGTLAWVSGISEANDYGEILHQSNVLVTDSTTTTDIYSIKTTARTYTYYHPRTWAVSSVNSEGLFKPGYWTVYEYGGHGTGRISYIWALAQKVYGTGSSVSYFTKEEYRLTIGTYNNSQITSATRLNGRSYTYQYLNDEIIPATDFSSYKYAVGGIGAVATVMTGDVDKLQSKYVLYVIDDNFEVKAYSAYNTAPLTNRVFNDITVSLADLKDENGKSLTDGYIVGMAIFPYTVPAEGCTVEFTGTKGVNVAARMYENAYKTAYNSATDPVVTIDGLTVSIPKDAVGSVYQYAAITGLNSSTTSPSIKKDTYTEMTLEDGVYTATLATGGLYYFKGVASIGESNEVLVYVPGTASERKALGVATDTGVLEIENNANFYIGEWGGTTYTWNNCDANYALRPSNNTYGWHLRPSASGRTEKYDGRLDVLYDAKAAYAEDPSDENATALTDALKNVLDRLTSIEAHYAYTPEEFIPADEVNSFTYKVQNYGTYDNFSYSGTDVSTQMILYVFNDKTGAVETYTWTKAHTEPVIGYNNTNAVSVKFDFTTADDNGKTLSDGYVVGMKFYPYIGFEAGYTDASLVGVKDNTTLWTYSLTVDPAGYDIDVPKISAPTSADFTITNDIVTVNTAYSYKYAQADKDGNYDSATLADVVSGETALTAGYWAFIKVSNDVNFVDSDAFILAHVAKATAPAITIDRNGYFVLDTTAEGYNADYEYEYLMVVTGETDLENLDNNTWTALNPVNIQVQEAGETYLVRVKAGALWTASDVAEAKSPKAILLGVSLVLDGQIGIKFTVDAKTAKAGAGKGSYTSGDPYMNMGVTGGTYRCTNGVNQWVFFNDAGQYANPSAFDYKAATGRCYSTVYVSAKDYNTTEVTFGSWRPKVADDTDKVAWPSGSTPAWGTTTVKKYIDLYKEYAEADPETYGAALPLVLALEEYCMNAENYFDKEATALDAVEAVDANIANAPEKTKDGTLPEGIEFYGTSLMLEDRTQIRYYFTVDSSLYTVEEDGTTITWNEGVVLPNADKVKTTKLISNGVIFYESAAITADKLGESVTETFTTETTSYTVVYSPLNYIAETYQKDAKTANLAKALYNYYKAADAYIVEE
ncbi:MAG: hypothetical protein E7582_00500 [Ruminococcaceae bacterium]|nr:hypothetical protein [Oscillospiraceae bacterium]